MNSSINSFKFRLQQKLQGRDIVIRDLFGKKHNKKLLFSYFVYPFVYPNDVGLDHTNKHEARELAKIFDNFGFSVDVVNYYSNAKIDFSRYDVVFGFGNLVESFSNDKGKYPNVLLIWYGMSCYPEFTRLESLKRLVQSYKLFGTWFTDAVRIHQENTFYQVARAEYLVIKGNDFIAGTYDPYRSGESFKLKTSVHWITDDKFLSEKDFSKAKKHFLWFGSSGVVRKGLDLLLESFKDLNDAHLHICGPVEKEKTFTAFADKYRHYDNIHFHGFIDLLSPLFIQLMRECGFIVFPSCAEGNCASVVTVMANGGLIPVITPNTGVDLGDTGISIEDFSVEAVSAAVQEALALEMDDFTERVNKTFLETRSAHSLEEYKKNVHQILKEILP